MMNKNIAFAVSTTADLPDSGDTYAAATCTAVTRLGWMLACVGLVVLVAALVLPGNAGFGGIAGNAHGERGQLNAIAAVAGAFGYLAGIALLGLAWVLHGEFGLD